MPRQLSQIATSPKGLFEAWHIRLGTTWFSIALRAGFLGTLIAVVYWPSFRGGFIWDDVLYFRDTPSIRDANGLTRIWFSTECRDYYPVTYSVYWAEWHLWHGRTIGYHMLNFALHTAGALLLWWSLTRWGVEGAWFAAALFAVHPVNVPSVSWICEVKNLLAFPLALLSLIAFQQYKQSQRQPFYAAALVCFILSLLAKPAVVGLPIVLGVAVWCRDARLRRRDFLELIPFFAVAVISGLITVLFQTYRALRGEQVLAENFVQRSAGAGWAIWFYFFKAVLPMKLSILYSTWGFEHASLAAYFPTCLFMAIIVYLWLRRRELRVWFAATVCYLALLLPVLGFFDQGYYAYARVADHWQYFALPVVCVLIVRLLRKLSNGAWCKIGTLVVFAVFGATTWQRAHAFASDEALWRQTISDNPEAWLAHYQFANYQARRNDWTSASRYYEKTLTINPAFAPAHYNLATALIHGNELRQAAEHLEQACGLNPREFTWRFKLGLLYLRLGEPAKARAEFKAVLLRHPDYEPAYRALSEMDEPSADGLSTQRKD